VPSRWVRFRHRWLARNCRCYVSRDAFLLTLSTPQGFPLRCGRWYFSATGPESQRNEIWPAVEELRMKRLVKPQPQDERYALVDPELFESHPSLFSFLADSEYDPADGGGKRALGSLSIWVDTGQYRAKLNDRDTATCCYVGGASLGELLDQMDAACSDPSAGWKPDPSARQKPKK